MYIIKVTLCKVGVSNIFFSKVIKEKPLGVGSTPLGIGRVIIVCITLSSAQIKSFICFSLSVPAVLNKTNDLILNLTPENVTQHSRIVTTTRKGSSTPTKMSKIIGRLIH